ncbi:Heterokaryon incompatibility domain-containing protein [Pleurotus pulmonarius]
MHVNNRHTMSLSKKRSYAYRIISEYGEAIRWVVSDLGHDWATRVCRRTADHDLGPPSLCLRCWERILGPHGWLPKALSSPSYRKLRPKCEYQQSLQELEDADKDGCRWCGFVLHEYRNTQQSELHTNTSRPVKIKVEIWMRVNMGGRLQSLRLTFGEGKEAEERLGHFFYAGHDDPTANFLFARSEIHDVNSPRAQLLSKEAIENCIHNHPGCPRLAENKPQLPTRVVDCQDPAFPTLIETNGRREQYVALSYVWGEEQPHSTTTANLANYLNGIDAQSLPKSIRDAISTVHAFGLRYLWADTLCIVQDSAEDKIRELGQMARIYASAYITVVAGSARKVSDGFLDPRSPPSRGDPSFKISCPTRAKELGTFSLGRDINYYRQELQEFSTDTDPVHGRGWCLQEMFLSQRTLVYTSRTLQYHCQTEVINIGGSVYQSDRFSATPKYWSLSYLAERDWATPLTPGPMLVGSPWERYASGVLEGWAKVLREYTRRSITVSTDKFHAIGAIAERFHQFRKSRYLAGLWEDTLLLDLLWTTVTDAGLTRPKEYRAPSWSWAALDNEVKVYAMLHFRDVQFCGAARCEVELKTPALPFGEVVSGEVILQASMLPVVCGNVISDYGALKLELYTTWSQSTATTSTTYTPIGDAILDNWEDERLTDMWAVPIFFSPKRDLVEGLLLAPVDPSSSTSKKYRRVGRWSVPQHFPEDPDRGYAYPACIHEAPLVEIVII